MKIVYLLPGGLFNSGGMERAVTIKADYLAEKSGHDVSIVTTEQMGRPVFYPLSEKVHLYHLDLGMYEKFGKESYLEKVISRFRDNRKYKKSVSKLLCEIRPDITISTLGGLDIEFLNDLKDGSVKIGELHFPGNFRRLMAAKLSKRFIPNYVAKIRTAGFRKKCTALSRLIVLTEEEKSSWESKKNIEVIPNPLPVYPEKVSALDQKQAIAVGRLAYEKGFDSLIIAWKAVKSKHPDWKLNIFGSGNQKYDLLQMIEANDLSDVIKIHEPVSDIYNHYLRHSFLVFPSRYLEALPMVLIESMSCGLPPVAFDAPCGPKDLIEDGKNGFLVQTGDIDALAEKMNLLIESETLRQSMGRAAKAFSGNFAVDKIMPRWIQLFEMLKQ